MQLSSGVSSSKFCRLLNFKFLAGNSTGGHIKLTDMYNSIAFI